MQTLLISSQTSFTTLENAYCTGKSFHASQQAAADDTPAQMSDNNKKPSADASGSKRRKQIIHAHQKTSEVEYSNLSRANSPFDRLPAHSNSVQQAISSKCTPPITAAVSESSAKSSSRRYRPIVTSQGGVHNGVEEKHLDAPSTSDTESAEDRYLRRYGYRRLRTISDHLQGEVFEAVTMDTSKAQLVRIKKADKRLYAKRIAIREGMHYVVDIDILREGVIAHHLTVLHQPPYPYLARFVGMFESESAIYLVTENVAGVTLQEFMQRAHLLILQKKLALSYWKSMLKYVMWQICVIVYWLHHDMNCCHLDLNLKTIMLQNADFIQKEDGSMEINQALQIKIVDFSYMEAFRVKEKQCSFAATQVEHCDDEQKNDDAYEYDENEFACSKRITTEKDYLLAPRVYAEEMYDARKADVWSIGIMLFQLATGLQPYHAARANDENYQRIQRDEIGQLVVAHDRMSYVNSKMLALMRQLLNVRERTRISALEILQSKWFQSYLKRYKSQIEQHSMRYKAGKQKPKTGTEHLLYYK